jgi:TonB-linked SusC/RagA family outer membrane protein
MNEDYKRRGFTCSKLLTTVAFLAFLINGNMAMARTAVPNSSITATEQQQKQNISGIVVDAADEPIIGASIHEKGTSNGAITDIHGQFTLKVKAGAILTITYVGYLGQETKASQNIKITMSEDSKSLNEVVVVGYGTQKKVNLTGAVSSIDVSKTLESRPVADISKALQGVVPGLTVINNSGQLNAEPSVSIRGLGTLSNKATSNPLIVVDGVPMDDISYLNPNDIQNVSVLKDAASTSIYGTRAAFGVILITTKSAKKTDRTTINYTNNFSWDTPTILPNYPDVPTQIKALIATDKRAGAEDQLFGMYLDDLLPLAQKWKEQHNGKAKYREMQMYQSDNNVGDFKLDSKGVGSYYADWDVKNIMFRKWKPSQSHDISIQGTSGKTSYFMSFGYNHQEGVMTFNPDKLNKYNVMMNISSDITDWLTVGGRLSYNDKDYTTPHTRRTTYQYTWRWGSFFGPYGTYQGYDFRNDIAYRKQAADTKDVDSYTRIGAFLKATIIKGLTLNADYTYNIRHYNENDSAIPITCWDSWGGALTSGVSTQSTSSWVDMTSERDKSYALNIYANYALNLNKDHHFNFMAGGNAEEGDNYSHYSERDDLLDYSKPEFNLATGNQYVDGSHSQWGACGYFGRLNYDYQGKYLLELNGRYDGSSKFPASNRWAFFPSGSAGYRISEENFFAPLKKYVSNAKIRGSYGEIGNQAVGDNMFVETISNTSTDWLDDNGVKVVSYGMPSLVSKTLKWERIQTLDLGLDLGLINNELNVTADWYQRTTKDMLAPSKTLPAVLGADAPKVNAGTLRTRGWEVNVDWHHTFNKDINVYASVNVNDYTTEITKWDNDTKLLNSNYSGKHYGDIWGFETDRLFTKNDFQSDGVTPASGIATQTALQSGSFVYGPGDIKFKDLKKDGKIDGGAGTQNDHGDLKVIGNTTPRYQYSFRLGGSWKGFDVDMFFQGVGKRDVWTTGAFVMPMMRGVDALYANQTDYWDADPDKYPNGNPNAEFPKLYPGGSGQGKIAVLPYGRYNFYPQTKYLINMAYLRFKNLTIGYTLPQDLTLKAYMQKVRFYFSANNLCELINKSNAPVDPEVNTAESGVSLDGGTWGRIDPMYRTVSFGVQVTF